MAKAKKTKTISCTVEEQRETENGVKHRLTFTDNEMSESGVNLLVKIEYMDFIPAKWKDLLEGLVIHDTLTLTLVSGTTQEKL
jgi:hypothetical protein